MKTVQALILTIFMAFFTVLSVQAQQQPRLLQSVALVERTPGATAVSPDREQNSDTKWQLNRKTGVLEKVITTKSVVDRINFNVEPEMFTSEELLSLANGKIVSHDDVNLRAGVYPAEITLPLRSYRYASDKCYQLKNRTVVQISAPHVLAETYDDYINTVLSLYGVGIGLILMTILFSVDPDNYGLVRFVLSLITALILAFFAGYYLDYGTGMLFGAFVGALSGIKQKKKIKDVITDGNTFRLIVGGVTGFCAGAFVGNSAGTIATMGKRLGDPAFLPVWQYIGYFFMVSLMAIGIRQILSLIVQFESTQKFWAVISLRKKLKDPA